MRQDYVGLVLAMRIRFATAIFLIFAASVVGEEKPKHLALIEFFGY